MDFEFDAVVIGSGPNGLAAAIYLQNKGIKTLIMEGASEVGGSTRTAELTEPGFKHDIGSAIHPLALASPYLSTLNLEDFGLEWVYPEYPLAHPMPDRQTVLMDHDIERFANTLGVDKERYLSLVKPVVENWDRLAPDILSPLSWPNHPLLMARFGLRSLWSAKRMAKSHFEEERTRTFFAGLAAHSVLPLDSFASSAFGLVLAATAHRVNWPFPKGGAHALSRAMVALFESIGGTIHRGRIVTTMAELPVARLKLFDLTPAQLLKIKGLDLEGAYRKKLNKYRYGPGAFKLDLALDGPVPWKDPACAKAATIHLGATFGEIEESEKGPYDNRHPDRPYVILAQHTLFDGSRAPDGKHTVWAYCHVPNGSTVDMTARIEQQIERVAPGFRKRIIGRSTMNTRELEAFNPNIVGGDINGGVQDIGQLFFRPVKSLNPYKTSRDDVYICSSATPPGGGVHGMCGYHAARTACREVFNL